MAARNWRASVVALAAALAGFSVPTLAATVTRVSVGAGGAEGAGASSRASVSADGRYVAFYSDAGNLVVGDEPPNSAGCPTCAGVRDVFVRDRTTGMTVRVSVASDGTAGNAKSDRPAISADGRLVTFTSNATNLVVGDFNGQRDIFVHDRDVDGNGVFDEPGQIATTRVSVSSTGVEANNRNNIPVISADGRYIAFRSRATNLIAAGTSGVDHVFVHDRVSGATVLVSAATGGVEGNATSDRASLSADGRYVAFFSDADNLVAGDSPTFDPAFCPACTGARDVFVHDRDPGGDGVFDQGDGQTTRVSVSSAGVAGNGSSTRAQLSADGRYVLFKSIANNLVAGDTNNADDVFVHDRTTGTTTRVNVTTGSAQAAGSAPDSGRASVSQAGRHVAFVSDADNLVPGDTNGVSDVFVHDRVLNTTVRISVDGLGVEGNGPSNRPSISANGRFVAFYSDASNLVPGDDLTFDPVLCPSCPGTRDIFVHDRDPGGDGVFDQGDQTIERVSLSTTGVAADGKCTRPAISADGRYVAFRSVATNLVPGDTNAIQDVFVHDRVTGATVRVSVDSAGVQTTDGNSDLPSISATGRWVAFWSKASTLVLGDDPPFDPILCPACVGWADIFVRDRDPDLNGIFDEGNGVTTRMSVSSAGVAGDGPSDRPWLASDGSWVGFISEATNLVAGDTGLHTDVFAHNLASGVTVRLSLTPTGAGGDFGSDRVTLSADGRFVGMRSKADDLVAGDDPSFDTQSCPACVGVVDVFVRDRDPDGNGVFDEANGITTRVSVNASGVPGDLRMGGPKISGDGAVIAMVGPATNLVLNDTNYAEDVFVKGTGGAATTVERVNVTSGGGEAATPILIAPDSDDASMSADARYVAFRSFSANLVPGDTNAVADVFVHDRDADVDGVFDEPGAVTTTLVSLNDSGLEADLASGGSKMTPVGNALAFYSDATNLVAGDTNLLRDVFVAELATTCSTNAACDDGNACTDDACDLASGTCTHMNNVGSCDDGNPCTLSDVCGGGMCSGAPVSCPAGQSCDPTDGMCKVCTHVAAPTADPSGLERSRYISLVPGNAGEQIALQVTVVNSPSFPGSNGTVLWVGSPQMFLDEDSAIPKQMFVGAGLQCAPAFHDWATVGLVHVFGAEIMPDTTYEVRAVNQNCGTGDPTKFSAALDAATGRWGDVVEPFFGPLALLQPDLKDITGLVAKFLAAPGAPIKASAQLHPNVVFPDRPVDFKDISADVEAFLGTTYLGATGTVGPCVCPPTVSCGVTACAMDSACGDGFCVDGFCTDACGRCTP